MTLARITHLRQILENLYIERGKDLPYHGWHHIYFVAKKAVLFAGELGADVEIVEAAALTHDLNYLVEPYSEPEAGKQLRESYLGKAKFNAKEIQEIETIVMQGHMGTRHADISDAAKALSDADTLYKSLPTTPILLTGNFIAQNKVDIETLAAKIVREQRPLMDQDIYFYTDAAKSRYMHWAKVNLAMWENVLEATHDPDVEETLRIARQFGAM